MRNLKRALSLALASVMLLGMMVVGSSAKGIDDFTDKAEIVNQDAVAVTSAIGMFEGYEDGSFGPENVVTRAEMAVIICTMLYGAGVNVNQFAETSVFTDVPAWAQGYVNLCSSLGIVAGVGDGKFDPNATVTTAQAVLMLCRALGYFQSAADFGNDWMLAATAKGTALGLYGDLKLTANAGLTRDNVAELVFNALTKAVPVQYNELLGVYYNENKGIIYSLTFYYTDTLGYKNFDLVYKTNENTDYGRPGTTWGIGSYRMDGNPSGEGNKEGVLNEDGSLIPERVKMTSDDEIITVADTPDFTYTANTKENVIYKAVGKSVVDDYAWNIYVDGAEQAGDDLAPANDKDTDYAYTAKGATTEIYVDDVNDTVTVVMINYYMAEVTKVKDGEVTVRVLSDKAKTNPIDERTITADGFAEDDYVVITVDVNDDDDSFVASIADPATAEGSVTYVAKASEPEDEDKGSYVKLDDGNKYTYSKYTASDLDDINEVHPTLDIAYRLYLDPNGYVIGFLAMDDYYANYLYVDTADSYLKTIEAKVVFTDGTEKKVTIDNEWVNGTEMNVADVEKAYNNGGLVGGVYAYSVDDDVYTLRPILDMDDQADRENQNSLYKNYKDVASNVTGAGAEIINDAAYITADGKTYIVDEDTVFVDVDENTIYTGFENVPDYKKVDSNDEDVKFWVIDTRENDGVLDVVFIYSGEASNSNDTYFYAATTDYETYDKNKNYKQHEVYVDGEKQTLVFSQTGHDPVNAKGLYKVLKTNGENVVTSVEPIAESQFSAVKSVGSRSFYLTETVGGVPKDVQYVTNSDSVVVVVTYDLKTNGVDYQSPDVSKATDLKDMKADEDYTTTVYVANKSDDGKTADLVYVLKKEIPTYDNTITFNGDGFTVVKEEGKFEVVDGNKIKVNDNQDVKFKLNITSGYELVSVKLGDEVLTASNGVYTINNVTKNLTVTVTTKPVAQAKGTVGIVDENSDAQALGVAYQGDKPTLDEALAAVRKYITDKGFVIDDANSSVDAAGKYTFAVTKGGYKAPAFTFDSQSAVTEGYIVTIDGEEKILANAAATITESNNMKITAPDGTVSYAKTVTIDDNGYVIEKGYSVTVTVDGEPQYFKAVGQQKTLPNNGKGTGWLKDGTTYVDYTSTSNFADGEEYVSGYVAVTGGVATENYVEAGKEATLNGVTNGKFYRITIGGEVYAENEKAQGTSLTIPAGEVTGDIEVTEVFAAELKADIKDVASTGMSLTWFVNGREASGTVYVTGDDEISAVVTVDGTGFTAANSDDKLTADPTTVEYIASSKVGTDGNDGSFTFEDGAIKDAEIKIVFDALSSSDTLEITYNAGT